MSLLSISQIISLLDEPLIEQLNIGWLKVFLTKRGDQVVLETNKTYSKIITITFSTVSG